MRFKEHLEGLVEVYKLTNTQAHEKTQAWMAIIALEADLHRKYMDELWVKKFRIHPLSDVFLEAFTCPAQMELQTLVAS